VGADFRISCRIADNIHFVHISGRNGKEIDGWELPLYNLCNFEPEHDSSTYSKALPHTEIYSSPLFSSEVLNKISLVAHIFAKKPTNIIIIYL
jgi:hypothetical protein